MLPEGKRAITRAISDQRVKARGPGCPQVNLPAQQPFRFNTSRTPPPGDLLTQVEPEGSNPEDLSETEAVIGGEGIRDQECPESHPFHQTEDSKAIRVQCQWHLRCCPSLIIPIGLDIPGMVGDIESKPV